MEEVAGARLVGRSAEQEEIAARIARAARGTGSLLLITGDAGIGKTAVAAYAAGQARAARAAVGWAACWQTAAVPPLWPWSQVLAQLAGDDRPVPDLSSTDVDLDVAQGMQADRVIEWLRDGRSAFQVIVIEDLHWADTATLALLQHLAAVLPGMRVLVVATARSSTSAPPAMAEALSALRRLAVPFDLEGLPVEAARALVAAFVGTRPSSGVARSLRDVTGGNPLFLRELTRSLSPAQLEAKELPAIGIPPSVRTLVTERVVALSADGRQFVEVLSVAGDESDTDLLAQTSGARPAQLLELVDEARSAGLVAMRSDEISFVHALFRDAVYDALSLADRTRWHDRIGTVLLARREGGGTVSSATLAHHFGRAAPLGNSGRAYTFAVEAASEAVAVLAYDLATRRFEQALAMTRLDHSLGEPLPLLLELADSRIGAGDFAGARATFAAAADEARRVGDVSSLGRAALGYSGGVAGIEVLVGDRGVCDLLSEAAAALADDDALGALVEARLSVARSLLTPWAERRAIAERALARARASGDDSVVAQALAAWCDVVAGPDHIDTRRQAAAEIIDHAERVGDTRTEALGRRLLVVALLEAGELAVAAAEVDRFEATTTRLGRSEYGWYPALWRAALALARGDDDEQRRWRAELARVVEEAGGTNGGLLSKVHDLVAALELDDPHLNREAIELIVSMGLNEASGVDFRVTYARLFVTAGDAERARVEIGPWADAAIDAERSSEWLPMMLQLSEVLVAIGGHPAVHRARAAIEPYAAVWAVEGIGAGLRGPAHRALGALAAADGDSDAAHRHLDAAGDAARRAGAVALAARIEVERARWLAAPSPGSGVSRAASPSGRFVHDGETWTLSFGGATSTLRDSKGLHDLAHLLAYPREEIAALELAAPGGTVVEGDSPEVIDEHARRAYRERLAEIDIELDAADHRGDTAASTLLASERDALLGELSGAFGLGGRTRTTGRTAERARTAVRARVRDALDRIEAVDPALANHLRRSVRTGTSCVYDPDPPVNWEL